MQVDYAEEAGTLYHFRYPLADGDSPDAHLPVATTRPETILGDTAVAVHPEDERYRHLIGQHCTVPLCDGRQASVVQLLVACRPNELTAVRIAIWHEQAPAPAGCDLRAHWHSTAQQAVLCSAVAALCVAIY